jgi:hypothetical protein
MVEKEFVHPDLRVSVGQARDGGDFRADGGRMGA